MPTSTPVESLDAIVLGSGEAGKFMTWHLAGSGLRVAVVERKWIGGSCPNTNCLPSKNEIWSAKVGDLVRRAETFGIRTGAVETDMPRVRQRKRGMVDELVAMHLRRYEASGGALVMGHGKFVAPKTIEVRLNDGGTRVLQGDRVFLNLGTHATIPAVPGLEAAAPLTNIELLDLGRLPEHLVVIGGGYVGLELGQAYRRFGSRVTIVERGPRLCSHEDPDVGELLTDVFRREGIDVLVETEVVRVEGRSGAAVQIDVRSPAGKRVLAATDVLVAVGRTPNTAGVGLDVAGVALDERGYVRVNDRLETTAPDTWALGECAGSPQFTHVSFDDFRIVRDNLAGAKRTTRGRLVPFCMFTDPPLARVGLNEVEASRAGVAVRVTKLPTDAILRTRTTGERTGFLKALVGAGDDRIRGFTMLGAEAGEVMAAVQTAMLGELSYTVLRDAVLTHPTMAEGLGELFSRVPPLPAR